MKITLKQIKKFLIALFVTGIPTVLAYEPILKFFQGMNLSPEQIRGLVASGIVLFIMLTIQWKDWQLSDKVEKIRIATLQNGGFYFLTLANFVGDDYSRASLYYMKAAHYFMSAQDFEQLQNSLRGLTKIVPFLSKAQLNELRTYGNKDIRDFLDQLEKEDVKKVVGHEVTELRNAIAQKRSSKY